MRCTNPSVVGWKNKSSEKYRLPVAAVYRQRLFSDRRNGESRLERGRARLLIAGACVGAVIFVGQIAFWVDELVVRYRLRPARIAVCIVSSWSSAITLLLVALAWTAR